MIYVGPLKALINDQFRRLDLLCENSKSPCIDGMAMFLPHTSKSFGRIPENSPHHA